MSDSHPAASTVKKVAIIKPCCIGDCVMALPTIDAVGATFPDAEIDLYIGPHSAPIFDGRTGLHVEPSITDIPSIRNVRSFALRLRAVRYDWIILLDRSRLLKRIVRFAGAKSYTLLDDATSKFQHESDVYASAVKPLGVTVTDRIPRLEFNAETKKRIRSFVEELGRPFVVIHPGGATNPGSVMIQKRWPEHRFIELIRELAAVDRLSVISGGPEEVKFCERIAEKSAVAGIRTVAGKFSLLETAALIEQATLFIGSDTGVSHLAAATGTPTIVIFGPTNPLQYAPRGVCVRILAPEGSYAIPNLDLRQKQDVIRRVSTNSILTADVLRACHELLHSTHRVRD